MKTKLNSRVLVPSAAKPRRYAFATVVEVENAGWVGLRMDIGPNRICYWRISDLINADVEPDLSSLTERE